MGARLIEVIATQDRTTNLGFTSLCTRVIRKSADNARIWYWSHDVRELLANDPQIILVDDTFRYGTTLRKVQAMLDEHQATLNGVAVLRNYSPGAQQTVPIISLEDCY